MVLYFPRKIKEKISKNELFRHINKEFFPYLLLTHVNNITLLSISLHRGYILITIHRNIIYNNVSGNFFHLLKFLHTTIHNL